MRLYSRMLAALLLNSECPILGWGAIQGTAHLLDPSSSSRPPAPALSTTTRYALVNGHPPIFLCTSAYLLVLTYSCVLVLTGMHWSMVTHQPSCVLVPTSTTTTLYAVTINSTSYYPLVLLPANTSTATCTRTCTKTNIKSLQLRPAITPTTNPVIGARLQSGFRN